MAKLAGTVNTRGRGRPALDLKETKVRLSPDQRLRIEALVGSQKMAEFIREAVAREIERREQLAR